MRVLILSLLMMAFTMPALAKNPSYYVKLWDDKGYTDRELTIPFRQDMGDFHFVNSDDGKAGFNDKASAAKWRIPKGWKAVLYENKHYQKRKLELRGRGENPDFGWFNDKPSSLRWEKDTGPGY